MSPCEAWVLAASAINADRVEEAWFVADEAMGTSGWERYRIAGIILQLTVHSPELLTSM